MVINVFGTTTTKKSYSSIGSLLSCVYCVFERIIFFWICITVVWNKNVSFQVPKCYVTCERIILFLFFFFDTREPLQVIIPPGFSVPNKVSPKPAGLQILTSKTATSLLITNETDALSTINIWIGYYFVRSLLVVRFVFGSGINKSVSKILFDKTFRSQRFHLLLEFGRMCRRHLSSEHSWLVGEERRSLFC